MTAGLRVLARTTGREERARHRLLVGAVALAGALLLASARIARVGDLGPSATFAPFVVEPGLRFGVVLGGLLVVVPVLVFAVQALRLGSAQRARRLEALRLAGATPADLRRLAALQAGRAGLVGSVLAGPAYLALWTLLGLLPGAGLRLLPPPEVADLLVWAGVVVLGMVGGAVAGTVTGSGTRRVTRSRGFAHGVVLVVLVVVVLVVAVLGDRGAAGLGLLAVGPVALVVLGPPVTAALARRMARRGHPVDLLAAARLGADPGPVGRVAGVLAVCGFAFAMQGTVAASAVPRGDRAFYLAGTGLAAAATLVAVTVAVLTLLVGAADQVVSARRSVAALHALGVEPAVQRRVLRRQLTAVSVPAVVVGALAGVLPVAAAMLASQDQGVVAVLVLLLSVPLAALAVHAVAALVVFAVRGLLAEVASGEGLRAD